MEAISVLLTLSGRAYGGAVEEEEGVDLITTGTLYPLKEGWKLVYTETQPDDNAVSDITTRPFPISSVISETALSSGCVSV